MIPHRKDKLDGGPFICENGRELPEITLDYETWGYLNSNGDNAILLCHALTGTSHVASGANDPSPGWWEFLVGPGKPVDTEKYFVVCSNVLGGCSGTTGPSSINPETGEPYGLSFPQITIRDMVHSQKLLIDHLKINKIKSIIGASMGAMQAMEWAALYPEKVESILPISAPGRAYPQSIAFRKAQRKAIMNDPDWQGGNYYGKSTPARGIELARMIGFITYRSETEFAQRFGRELADENLIDLTSRFEIESYLEYHGQKLAKWFDANTYLYLSKAMDLHDLGRGYQSYEAGIQKIKARTRIIGIDSDLLFPYYQQEEFARILRETNPDVKFIKIHSLYGHDAFLVEERQISEIVRQNIEKTESDDAEILKITFQK